MHQKYNLRLQNGSKLNEWWCRVHPKEINGPQAWFMFDVAVLYSFPRACFYPAASLRFSSLAPTLCVNRVSSVIDRWRRHPTSQCTYPSASCPFFRPPWSEDVVALLPSYRWPDTETEGPSESFPSVASRVFPSQWGDVGVSPSRAQALAGFYEISAVVHAACLPSSRHRCCPFNNRVQHMSQELRERS